MGRFFYSYEKVVESCYQMNHECITGRWERYNDYFNTLESAHKQGEIEEKVRTACSLKDLGVDVKIISQASGLSIEEIEKL